MPEKKTYAELIIEAQHCENNKQWQAAIFCYDAALALHPGNPGLLFRRAQLKLLLDNYQEALEDYDSILAIDPASGRAWFQKGIIWGFLLGDTEKALAHLDKISADDQLLPPACLYKGILYYNQKDYVKAGLAYDHALAQNPGFGDVYYFRALVQEATGAPLQALSDYQAAIKNGFTYSDVFYNLALVYARFRNFEQAGREFLYSYAGEPYRMSSEQLTPCHYFHDHRQAAVETIYPNPEKIEKLSVYLERGFVRFANYYFRHTCPECKACIPLRVLTDRWVISRSLKRTLKRNSDLRLVIPHTPLIDSVRAALFGKYYKEKHKMDNRPSPEQDIAFRHLGFKNSYELDFYLADELVAVHIVDAGADALYAAYLYYDTSYLRRRLGVYCIAKAIEFAARLGKAFYYMGWYIEDLPVMSYKKQFRPNQLLIDGEWRDFC